MLSAESEGAVVDGQTKRGRSPLERPTAPAQRGGRILHGSQQSSLIGTGLCRVSAYAVGTELGDGSA